MTEEGTCRCGKPLSECPFHIEPSYRRRFYFQYQHNTGTSVPDNPTTIFPDHLSNFYWLGPANLHMDNWAVEVFNEAAVVADRTLDEHPAVAYFHEMLDGGSVID